MSVTSLLKRKEKEGRTKRTNWEKVWFAKEKEKENRTNMQKGFISNHIWVLTAITTHGCLKNEHGHKAKHTQNSLFSQPIQWEGGASGAWKKESLGTKRLTSFVLSVSLLSITWTVWSSAWSVPKCTLNGVHLSVSGKAVTLSITKQRLVMSKYWLIRGSYETGAGYGAYPKGSGCPRG